MSLKLGLYRKKQKLCCFKFCDNLPSHSHSEIRLKNELLDNLLQPQLSQALLEWERTFKQIYSSTFERCREQTTRSHAYRNRFKLGHHLEIGQKVLHENHKQDLTRSKKLQQGRRGPFAVTKRITNTTYQIQDDKDPTVIKTIHRNHLVEYYPKEESLPAMIEEYVPSDHQNDNFYESFMEQRTRDLNNPSTTEEHDSFPFPIEPLRFFPPTNKPKRFSTHSNDSGITSPLASSRTPMLSLAVPMGTSTPIHLLLKQHNLLICRPGTLLAQFNTLFVTVPPAWLEIALNRALKSPNITDCSQITRILSQFWGQSLNKAINFDPLYIIATFL